MTTRKTTAIAASIAMLLTLAACGKQGDERTVGQQIDGAVAKSEQAAKNAADEAKSSMATAGTAVKEQAAEASANARQATAAIAEKLDDAAITASVSASLAKDPELSALKIDVDTKNGVVNLYGPAPSDGARERATSIAKSVKGVNTVNNQLTVKAG